MKLPRIVFLRADLKGVEKQLDRIAHALEIAVGIAPTPPPLDEPGPSVAYSTAEDLLREEFAKASMSAKEGEPD